MQTVRYADAELKTRGINHRVGTFKYKELGEGLSGTPGNFNLRMVWSETDFFSPRHMHNFDQVRVQIQGTFHFDNDGSMKPGVAAYFPEGTPYGPQTSREDTATLVMQIGGASGNGYLSEAERVAAVDQLAKIGRFGEGRYFSPGDKAGTDGFQAAWEFARGRKMQYPPRRFQKPVFTHPDGSAWLPVPGKAGLEHKRLWNFGERTVGLDQYRMAAGASFDLVGAASCFIESGNGRFESPDSQGRFEPFDTIHLQAGEPASFTPDDAAQLLVFVHPVF